MRKPIYLVLLCLSVTLGRTYGQSASDWKLGVQLWTFMKFDFVTAISKVDSAGVKYVEAYSSQPLGGGMKGNFGPDMTPEEKTQVKQLLRSKGITIVAMGVIVPRTLDEWKKYFIFGKEFGLSYFTAEPIKTQWGGIDSLAGIYGIKVAIHDHPRPNVYWHPDSVLAAIAGHPNIGACADLGHWARNGLDPVECLQKLEGHIIGVHLKDIVQFDNTHAADTVVGSGVLRWAPIFQELKRQHFKGMLSIEHESNWYNSVPDVIRTREFFNALVYGSSAADVRNEFIRSWAGYKKYAWGHDVLLPVTGGFSDWYKESLHISPIDAYSTMRVMGLDKEAREVEQYVLDSVSFDKDIFVKTFEVNIRILGGLLSMYQWTHNPLLLEKAKDFGDRELKAFDSPTGIPYYWVNLKTGVGKGDTVNTAEAGSYCFEMGILSYYTRDPRYYAAGKKATRALYTRRSSIDLEGFSLNASTGQWIDTRSFIGAGADSYFEYLYKSWLLFKDPDLKAMWDTSIAAINKYIPEESDTSIWYGFVDMHTGAGTNSVVTLYDAFFPSILAMNGDLHRAEKLQHTWDWLWNRYGLEPMEYDFHKQVPLDPVYDLNPEIIESAFYLHSLTGKQRYRDMGQTYYNDILQYCRTPIAFSSISDVRTKQQNNELPTFFFAETMKYFYLLFGGNPSINIRDYVFNTEANPFRKADFGGDVRKRLNIR